MENPQTLWEASVPCCLLLAKLTIVSSLNFLCCLLQPLLLIVILSVNVEKAFGLDVVTAVTWFYAARQLDSTTLLSQSPSSKGKLEKIRWNGLIG